jgi:hypothetical protein
MNIVKGWPPNVDQLDEAFGVRKQSGLIFSWGSTVYVPGGEELPRSLRAHEAAHGARQTNDSAKIEAWWTRYIADQVFRFEEELFAHKAEYRNYCDNHRDGNSRARYLHQIGQRLASKLYGGLISPAKARAAIAEAR